MANRVKGEVTVDLDGASYTLCLDMNAMIALEDRFSTPDKPVTFAELFVRVQANSMRHVLAFLWVAFLKHHPGLTEQDVNDLIQKSGGIFEFSAVITGLATATEPDPTDVKALGIKPKANPQKAQAQGGTGVRSISRRAG